MKAPAVEWVRRQGHGYTVWTEAPVRAGHADVVGVDLREERCEQRYREGPVSAWGGPAKIAERLIRPMPDWYPAFRPQHVAIELKLENRVRAFSQASSYLMMAHWAYVGMPPEPADRALEGRDWDDFRAECHGIGLLAVRPDGVEVLREPERSDYETAINTVQMAERAWRYWYKQRREQDAE